MNAEKFFDWVLFRFCGIRDIVRSIKYIFASKIKAKHWGTIYVHDDSCIGSWLDHDFDYDGPYWYDTRLFSGIERDNFGTEYWLVTTKYFYAPLIPFKIVAKQEIFNLGKNCDAYNQVVNNGSLEGHHLMPRFKYAYTHEIIEKADISFADWQIRYSDSPVWATYD